MTLEKLIELFRSHGCVKLYVKELAPNNNSKNQIYFAGNFQGISMFPFSKVHAVEQGIWERPRFWAYMDFSWMNDEGKTYLAPEAKLILYPKYPEVRFSGFVDGCENPPSAVLNNPVKGRLLFIGVNSARRVIGYVSDIETPTTNEFNSLTIFEKHGVFKILTISRQGVIGDTKPLLLNELKRIHQLGWINSKRLKPVDGKVEIVPCNAQNCGGYTLEAELGVASNADAKPDFLGWEIKQYAVNNFRRNTGGAITLMTPEPTGGFYRENGMKAFAQQYGVYNELRDRLDFTGSHYVNNRHQKTNLMLHLEGFDPKVKAITRGDGAIQLIDDDSKVVASWSFNSLIEHWNRKHAKAAYIPSLKSNQGQLMYSFGNIITLGIGTDFNYFLFGLTQGITYYDPGIKVEKVSTIAKGKPRSQFRIKAKSVLSLYHSNEIVDLSELG